MYKDVSEFTTQQMIALPGQSPPSMGDGVTYKRSPKWQSPEGNFYGQQAWVMSWPLAYVWDGTKYIKFESMGLVPSFDRLPDGPRSHFEIWITPRDNWPQMDENGYVADSRPYDYHWWNADDGTWHDVEWFQIIWPENGDVLPYPGYKIGAAHQYIKYNIQAFWDGFCWRRQKHSDWIDDEPEKHVPFGLLGSFSTLQLGYNELVASYLGSTSTGNTELDEAATANIAMRATLEAMSDLGWITLAESIELKKYLAVVVAESTTLIATARTLEGLVDELDLSDLTDDYSEAITDLEDALEDWIDATEYPVEITGSVSTRATVDAAIAAVLAAREALRTALQNTNVDYVDAQVSQVDEALGTLEENVGTYFSDAVITFIEASSLKTGITQVNSESTDIIAVANSLLVTTGTVLNYTEALDDLDTVLDSFIDQEKYPIEITTQQRLDIINAFATVQSTKTLLLKAIEEKRTQTTIEYIDQQVAELDSAFASMSADIINWTIDLSVSSVESDALEVSMTGVQSQADDLEAIAASLAPVPEPSPVSAITAAKNAFSDSLAALFVLLAPYINQTSYPVALTQNAKDAIVIALNDTRSKKLLLEDAISSTRISNLYNYVDDQIGDVNEAVGDLGDDIALVSDDGYITLAEANEIKRIKAQFDAESIDIIAIAAGLAPVPETNPVSAITTKKLAYSASLTALTNALASWITSVSYPLEIKGQVTTKAAMSTALANVKTAQAALTKEIQASNAYNLGVVSGSLDSLQDDVDLFSDNLTLMLYEAASLSSNWDIITGKYNSLISLCSTLSITSSALTSAYGALHTELDTTWINQASYPKALVSGDRARLSGLLIDYNEEETLIVSAINNKQAVGAFDDGFDASQFKQVYDGIIRGFTPELELVYISENELCLKPNYSDFDYLTVNEQNIQASKRTSVFTQTPVLTWSESNHTLSQSVLQPETEYYVYLANRYAGFMIESGATPYDYRGRLFCSETEPSNNYLGESGSGLNAIYIGRAETSVTTKFIHEIDVSVISRTADTKETFREFSDFDLIFVDEDTLRLQKTYGLYGQMYIPESLYYLGDDREIYTSSNRVEMDSQLSLILDETAIAADSTYYIYIAGDIDLFNFNSLNSVTQRPWHPEDVGAGNGITGPYYAAKDLRLYMFLSTVLPDNGRLDESYKGFWTRWIGIVQTDANGKFKYSSDLSIIRQPAVNPTHLDGIAEISIQQVSSTRFNIVRKRGTTGLVFVNGEPMYVYDSDHPYVNYITSASIVYTYNEGNVPCIVAGTDVSTFVGKPIYLYMLNSNQAWGEMAASIVCCSNPPNSSSLSTNFPGSNSRWLATIRQAPNLIGNEEVTNGSFASDSSWIYDKGWSYSSGNKNVSHISGTAALQQSLSLIEGQLYNVIFTTSSRTTGSVVVSLGGTSSSSISSNAVQSVNLSAGSGAYIQFIPSQGYDGLIDSVSVKATSLELTTNGTFETNSSWSVGAGWSYDTNNKLMSHAESYDWLTQSISVSNGASCTVNFSISGMTTGTVTPCLGGTDGTAYSSNGAKSASITSGSGGYIKFKASATFDGTIDSVAVLNNSQKVVNGSFTDVKDPWDIQYPWHFNGDNISYSGGGGGTFSQTISIVAGRTYSVAFYVGYMDPPIGSVYASLGGTAGTSRTAQGTYTENIVAGSSGTISFIQSSDFGATIDNVSVIDVTSVVTNGTFESSSSWTWGSGWTFDNTNKCAIHTFAPDFLSQSVSVTQGNSYLISFTTAGRTTGSVIPCLGGTQGSSITDNTSNVVTIIAGSGGYIRFEASDDYNGSIDLVSVKLTGLELTTNGNFDTDTVWDRGVGWIWDNSGYHMDHISASILPISQSLATITGDYYEVLFTIGDYVAGSLVPSLGGTLGLPEASIGTKIQHIFAGASNNISILPSSNFQGSLDNISVKKTAGVFDGSFLLEASCSIDTSINDSIISYTETWSSARIQAEILKGMGLANATQSFEAQKTAGVPVRLEYVDSGHIRLVSTIGDIKVFFSSVSSRDVTNSGITIPLIGSAGTMYYVWLSADSMFINTTPPSTVYQNISMLGEYILVGYLSFSATNAIAGNWNIYSFWNQPTQQWTADVVSTGTTTLSVPGFISPPSVSSTIMLPGSMTARFLMSSAPGEVSVDVVSVNGASSSMISGSTFSGDYHVNGTTCTCKTNGYNYTPCISGNLSSSLSPSSVSSGIINSFSCTYSASITSSCNIVDGGDFGNFAASSSVSITHSNVILTLTRFGNI